MSGYLLDTDVCVHAMRDRLPVLRERFSREEGRLFISVITLAELAFGSLKSSDPARNDARLAALVARLVVLPFDAAAASAYAAIRVALERAGTPIGPNDISSLRRRSRPGSSWSPAIAVSSTGCEASPSRPGSSDPHAAPATAARVFSST